MQHTTGAFKGFRSTLIISLLLQLTLANSVPSQEFEIEVSSIRVWVAVEGTPKQPLTQNDFEIFEDGKKMTPTCFEQVGAAASTASIEQGSEPAAESSEPQGTLTGKRIAVLVDEFNTSQGELLYVKPKLHEFLDEIDGKSQVMLATVPPFGALVPFTNDTRVIREKFDTITGNQRRDRDLLEKRRKIQLMLEKNMGAGNVALEFQMQEVQELQLFIEALAMFAKYLNEMDQTDHTVVVLISGGVNSRPGQQYLEMAGLHREDMPLGAGTATNIDVEKALRKATGKLNRDNLTIYTINTRGQSDVIDEIAYPNKGFTPRNKKELMEGYQQGLDQIADETGGLSFKNSLNFKRGFDLIMNDLDKQYLLCYTAPEHEDEGEYHQIKVKSKVKGLKLRHRSGYVD